MAGVFKIGVFDEEKTLIASIKSLQEKNLAIHDVFTPYPIHEVLHLLKRKSKLPTAALIYGISGALGVLAFLYYTSVINWPVNYGGKPFNSFPSFIVITIVLTILTVTITSLFTFSVRAKLFPGQEPLIFDERATDDKFILVLDANLLGEEAANEAGKIMKDSGAVEIIEKELNSKK
jgi:hypothetical protein